MTPPRGHAGRLELGLGLLSVGRIWGTWQVVPPDEQGALTLLERAFELGIQVLDTAPAYAASEALLGRFLAGLSSEQRATLTVMTKTGEHWDAGTETTFVDHGHDALRHSIDRSLDLLGRFEVLQVHKAMPKVVSSPDVLAAIEHARTVGVRHFGASDVGARIQAGGAGNRPGIGGFSPT